MKIYFIDEDTRHYSLQAFGTTEAEAKKSFKAMWHHWCRQSGADTQLFGPNCCEVNVQEIHVPGAYFDRSLFWAGDAGS